jgi:hypothetical protein
MDGVVQPDVSVSLQEALRAQEEAGWGLGGGATRFAICLWKGRERQNPTITRRDTATRSRNPHIMKLP